VRIEGRVVYRRRALSLRPWIVAWTLLVLFAVVPPWFVDRDESVLYRLAVIPVYAITWAAWVWIVLLALWSINFYRDVTVTDRLLRVGRDRIPLTEIAPLALRNTLNGLTGAPREERAGEPAAVNGPVRQLGGARAGTLGARFVVVPLRDREARVVETRDPVGFLRALVSVVPQA
jgi:hypothetical protein